MTQPVFDGHNDVLLKLWEMADRGAAHIGAVEHFINGCQGHIDLPRARKGSFAGGFFAIYVPSDDLSDDIMSEMLKPAYDLPLPEAVKY